MTDKTYNFSALDSIFGAANSFTGFKNDFGKIFNPELFDKIFILKGGPGTGKSTLMKSVAKYGKDKSLTVKYIYCSSDPNSLDGVILAGDTGRIAVIDGTAPHMTDPLFPGAKEEIINLGEGFKVDLIESHSDRIISLGKEKSHSYKNAYSVLGAAGCLSKLIEDNIVYYEPYFRAETQIVDVFNMLKKEKRACRTHTNFVAAFCKNGYVKLPLDALSKTQINLSGSSLSCYLLMERIRRFSQELGIIEQLCLSPLTPSFADRIYTEHYVFTVNEGPLGLSIPPVKLGDLSEELMNTLRTALSLAVGYLSRASAIHFDIEKIYIGAMDFSSNQRILTSLISRLDKIYPQ